jgi:hypothetical protein
MGRWPSLLPRILHTPCARFSKTGTRYRVPGLRSRVPGTWDPIPGTGFAPRAEYRAPKTESSYWKTRTPGMHPVSCIHILTRQ